MSRGQHAIDRARAAGSIGPAGVAWPVPPEPRFRSRQGVDDPVAGCRLDCQLGEPCGLHPSGLVRLDPVAARFAADGLSPKDHGELLSDLPVDLAHHLGRVRPTNPVIRTVTPAFSAVARTAASAAPSPSTGQLPETAVAAARDQERPARPHEQRQRPTPATIVAAGAQGSWK